MNSLKKLAYMLVLLGAVAFISCKDDDDDPTPCSWTTDLQAELDALIEANADYNTDPSNANCIALETAGNAYINELQGYQSCASAAGQSVEWQQSLNAAMAYFTGLPC